MIYELRQYTLWPGKRDALVDLFDREFVESQEATGMRVDGQFRDADRPDRFEPRRRKRRPKPYDRLMRPRHEAKRSMREGVREK